MKEMINPFISDTRYQYGCLWIAYKNDVNMFYKNHKLDGKFIWKFNHKWNIYQSNETDQMSASKTTKILDLLTILGIVD